MDHFKSSVTPYPSKGDTIRKRFTLLGGSPAVASWRVGDTEGQVEIEPGHTALNDRRFRSVAFSRATDLTDGTVTEWEFCVV